MKIQQQSEFIVNEKLQQVGIRFVSLMGKSKRHVAVFLCQCGNRKVMEVKHVLSGESKTCGCGKEKGKHCLSGRKTKLYKKWISMRERCSNPNKIGYHNYGGRGIRVCERWNSFDCFQEDMGECPEGSSIDRIDVNGSYCPENCRWSSRKEQCRNTRVNHYLQINGITKTIAEWSEEDGARKQTTIWGRISKGIDAHTAVFGPVRNGRMR